MSAGLASGADGSSCRITDIAKTHETEKTAHISAVFSVQNAMYSSQNPHPDAAHCMRVRALLFFDVADIITEARRPEIYHLAHNFSTC